MMTQVFRGRTLSEARDAAEAVLGSDAVVLTTRKVPRRGFWGLLGGKEFEVSATSAASLLPPPQQGQSQPPTALSKKLPFSEAVYKMRDSQPSIVEEMTARETRDLNVLRQEFRNEIRQMQVAVSKTQQVSMPNIESEFAALRDAIENMASSDAPRGGPLVRLLRARGIEGKAASVISRVAHHRRGDDDTVAESVRDALADLIRVSPWPLAGNEKKLIALVGPSGIGKTTTAAKLAARAVIEQNRTVTLIACDVSRVGAADQLKRYANLLEAEFEIATTPADLNRIIAAAKTDLVIVDTAGKMPVAPDSIEASLGTKTKNKIEGRTRHVLLAMPGVARANDAERIWRTFRGCNPNAMIVTKLDETDAPAGLVHGAISSHLPVCAMCFGHRVPEDIGPATMGSILDYLVPLGSGWRQAS